MSHLHIFRSTISATAMRLTLLAILGGLPLLAIPAKADRQATMIEGSLRSTSSAGLMIVMAVQRAR